LAHGFFEAAEDGVEERLGTGIFEAAEDGVEGHPQRNGFEGRCLEYITDDQHAEVIKHGVQVHPKDKKVQVGLQFPLPAQQTTHIAVQCRGGQHGKSCTGKCQSFCFHCALVPSRVLDCNTSFPQNLEDEL
jgi:hypothetical protein